jgi:hypothetical protein
MPINTGLSRAIITDNSPMAISIEWKRNADVLLSDVALIQHNFLSSGPHILLAHAIELLLKAYLKGVAALKPGPKEEDYGHAIDRLLDKAKKAGLTLSDPDSEELVHRLARATEDARLRYVFGFEDLPPPTVGLRVARAISKDISSLVKPESPEEIAARRKLEQEKLEMEGKRKIPFPDLPPSESGQTSSGP